MRFARASASRAGAPSKASAETEITGVNAESNRARASASGGVSAATVIRT